MTTGAPAGPGLRRTRPNRPDQHRAGPSRPDSGRTAPGRPARARGRRRWHRAVIPFLVLGLVYLATGVAHRLEEPDLGDAGTLSPTGTGPDGSSRLAALLAERGVTVRRVTSSTEAVRALAGAGDRATVFVPAPDLVSPRFFGRLAERAGGHRLVLLRPGPRTALATGFLPGYPHWAARAVPPGCAADFATAAGRAAVLRSVYAAAGRRLFSCYRGGLVGLAVDGMEVVAVGATDPFRNSRVGEVGNARLATGLLGRDRVVIWVDVHAAEPRDPGPGLRLPRYEQPDRASGGGTRWTAFPPMLWATLALLLVVAVLLAIVRGRRLGPPVAEPLPVLVPATETVTGRGRLYRRARSRPETLAALTSAALRRITPSTAPGAPVAAGDELIAHLAARTGIPAPDVRSILRPPPPETDEELTLAVARLDHLVAAVVRVGARPTDPAGAADPGGPVTPGGTP